MLLVLCIHTFMQAATLKIETPLINQRRNHITAHGQGRKKPLNYTLSWQFIRYTNHNRAFCSPSVMLCYEQFGSHINGKPLIRYIISVVVDHQ